MIHHVLHNCLVSFSEAVDIFNNGRMGFRCGCSVHVNNECLIRTPREQRKAFALVTLDIAKAYGRVEQSVLLERLVAVSILSCMLSWIQCFLTGRSFFCWEHCFHPATFPQTSGVPQGSVLAPLLFNMSMSLLPLDTGVQTIAYRFLLLVRTQSYLDSIPLWCAIDHLPLNVEKSAVIVFPTKSLVHIDLRVSPCSVRQKQLLTYLGIWYDDRLVWHNRNDYITARASEALGISHQYPRPSPERCDSRTTGVCLTSLRRLAPHLHCYLHRAGLRRSHASTADEAVDHFLLNC